MKSLNNGPARGSAGGTSLDFLILAAGAAIGVFLLLRGMGQAWNGIGDNDGALFGSIARNYLQFGIQHLHGGQLVSYEEISQPTGNYYLHHPPLLPMLVAACIALFGDSETVVRLVSVLSTLLTATLLYFIAGRAGGARVGALAAFFFLALPTTVIFGRKPGYEALTLFFVVLAVWLYQRYRESGTAREKYFLFAAIALAAASDWPAYFLPPALLLHAIVYRRDRKIDWNLLVGLALVPSLVLFAFLWSIYVVDKNAILDLLHQGLAYAGFVAPDSHIAQHVIEARITFTPKEYVFRLLRNLNLNFGILPIALAMFGLAALRRSGEFRGIVLVLAAVALGDCLVFWRSLYFHLWWEHLISVPLAILSAVAVHTLMRALARDAGERNTAALGACRTLGSDSENRPRRGQFSTISPGNSRTIAQEMGEKWAGAVGLQPEIPKSDRLLGSSLLVALVLPMLFTLIYNVWQLSQEQIRMLPPEHKEAANFFPELGAAIHARTAAGDWVLTNLAPPPHETNPYARILPYYARRAFQAQITTPDAIQAALRDAAPGAGQAHFLLWRGQSQTDRALADWLERNAISAEIAVAGHRFGFFALKDIVTAPSARHGVAHP